MKELKWTLILLMMFSLLMFAEPVLARRNRKKDRPAPRAAPSKKPAPNRSASKQSPRTRSIPSVQRPAPPRISAPGRVVQGPRIGKMSERRIRKSPSISSRSSTLFESLLNRRPRKIIPRQETRRKEPSLPVRQDRSYDRKWRGTYYRHYPFQRRIFYPIIWPSYYYPIYYDYGPWFTFGYVWPYYHRRYIFVSLGGYWPWYSYRRYYWYPCHPYRWYGHYPIQAPVPDHDALEKPCEKPAEVTQADRCFEEGVKTFENGNYADAIAWFHNALELAPDDIVLPFAYIQALFADGQYQKAVEVLCSTLSKVLPQEQGVFYPRGLYSDENVLKEQIEQLSRAVKLNPFDSDLQLLLGYQLLGMARFDEATKPLENAQKDPKNTQAATRLLDLLNELKKANQNKVN